MMCESDVNTKWKLALLAGAMFMLAGFTEFLAAVIAAVHSDASSHRAIPATSVALGAMFVAVGALWLTIGATRKRKSAAEVVGTVNRE